MNTVFLGQRRIAVDPSSSIGKGGEADVYLVDGMFALKLFKGPDHPDLLTVEEKKAARARIAEHQSKLPDFPKGLPSRVVVPLELARENMGVIVGYLMNFVDSAEPIMRLSEKHFRQGGFTGNDVVEVFKGLHATVKDLHKARVVIGDFNDLNVLVKGREAWLIDADSFQFGRYFSRVYTVSFVDPLLCDLSSKTLELSRPYRPESDWYSFSVILMQSLLLVGPYGGVYRPKNKNIWVPPSVRPLKRITVFNPEVVYPKVALHYRVLPDDLLNWFLAVFDKDQRGEFPLEILEGIRWTKCLNCGLEHARSVCPECSHAAVAISLKVLIKGQVSAERIFATKGVIVFASWQEGKLKWLYNEEGRFKREDGSAVAEGEHAPLSRYRISGENTLIGLPGRVMVVGKRGAPATLRVDNFGNLPVFDANASNWFWIDAGVLKRNGEWAPENIGNTLSGQTLFWVGGSFGFGFYRAGLMSVAFVFDAQKRGINDTVQFPSIRGQLADSTCVFTDRLSWFLTSTREGGRLVNRCFVVSREGKILASSEAEEGDGSWLGGSIRGKVAVANLLFCPTDRGIVRVELEGGAIKETREYPDTEQFVGSGYHLFLGEGGLHVVGSNEILLLRIN